MADHVLTLNQADEEALAWASVQTNLAPESLLREWIQAGLAEGIADLNRRLEALGKLDSDQVTRVKRALLRQPDPRADQPVRTPAEDTAGG